MLRVPWVRVQLLPTYVTTHLVYVSEGSDPAPPPLPSLYIQTWLCYAGVFHVTSIDTVLPHHHPSLLSSTSLLNNTLLLLQFFASHRYVELLLSPASLEIILSGGAIWVYKNEKLRPIICRWKSLAEHTIVRSISR